MLAVSRSRALTVFPLALFILPVYLLHHGAREKNEGPLYLVNVDLAVK